MDSIISDDSCVQYNNLSDVKVIFAMLIISLALHLYVGDIPHWMSIILLDFWKMFPIFFIRKVFVFYVRRNHQRRV